MEPWATDVNRPLILKKLREYLITHGRKIKKTARGKPVLVLKWANVLKLWEKHKPRIRLWFTLSVVTGTTNTLSNVCFSHCPQENQAKAHPSIVEQKFLKCCRKAYFPHKESFVRSLKNCPIFSYWILWKEILSEMKVMLNPQLKYSYSEFFKYSEFTS